MADLLEAILNIINNNELDLISYFRSRNKINAVGDSLEYFIKDAFYNPFDINTKDKGINIYPNFFSYEDNFNNPSDLILRSSDAIEVKKIESLKTAIDLNSSYPKSHLFANDPMITNACRNSEDSWQVKAIIYAIAPHYPQNPSAYFPHQTAIAPHHPKLDRLFPQIKQRSPFLSIKISS